MTIGCLVLGILLAGALAAADEVAINAFDRQGNLSFYTVTNTVSCRVEWSTNLPGATWSTAAPPGVAEFPVAGSGTRSVTVGVQQAVIFYRVVAKTAGDNLPPLWNASPPTGVSPAPSGPLVGVPGEFDTGILATNEVWDNFIGAVGSDPDARLWLEDTINQGGTQVYDPARSFLDGNGNAVFEAIQSGGTIYSGRFTSRTKFNMQYGWCAARIKFPKAGRAWFPAFWLLFVGFNTGNPYGEIDMMEFFGDTQKYSTHVFFGQDPYLMSEKAVPDSHSGGNAGDGFHTYWMQWEPDRIWIGVDDLVIGDWNPDSVPAGHWDHMRQPFYFIANFAVAPSWLPPPEPGDFPARMLIDWIWYKPLTR